MKRKTLLALVLMAFVIDGFTSCKSPSAQKAAKRREQQQQQMKKMNQLLNN